MATVRLYPTEMQFGDVIYVFKNASDADDFESCVATVDVKYCELKSRRLLTDNRRFRVSSERGR
jgi:hypothetical protein